MDNETILIKVKSALGITGNYQDETLKIYIDEVIAFMTDAGVNVDDLKSVGVICKGVTDLWNYGAGEGKLSEYFKQRVTQLSFNKG